MRELKPLLEATLLRARPERASELRLRLRARSILGPELADRTRVRLEGRKVVLEIEDPRWAAQVHGLLEVIEPRLRAAVANLESLEVRVVTRSGRAGAAAEPVAPAAPAAAPPELRPALERAVGRIADPALGERMREVARCYLDAKARKERRG